jgi:hypothetical protein
VWSLEGVIRNGFGRERDSRWVVSTAVIPAFWRAPTRTAAPVAINTARPLGTVLHCWVGVSLEVLYDRVSAASSSTSH